MSARPWVMAIDFGTSYTVAAGQAEGGNPEIIEINGERRTPSVILVEGPGQFVVGQVAEDLGLANPQAVVRAPKNRLGDQAPAVVGGRPYQVVDLVAALLSQVYQDGVRQFGGPPREVRLTHPATWNRPRLLRLVEAAAKARITDPVLVPEPVAAALAYWSRGDLPEGGYVAVYDLGGGTFDTAVVQFQGGAFRVVGRAGGDSTVGGELFDEVVANAVGEELEPATWEELQVGGDTAWRRAAAALRTESRKAKETLSSHTYADVVVSLPTGTMQRRISREEFEELVTPYVDETVTLLHRCVRDAGLAPGDLAAIQLVGGASRIPLVERSVIEAFPGLQVHRRGDPKTTVALGALLATGPSTTPLGASGRGSTEDSPDRTAPVAAGPLTPPPAAALPPVLPPPPSTPPPPATRPQPFAPQGPAPVPLPARARSKGPLIAVGAVVAALALGGAALLVLGGGDDSSSDRPDTTEETQDTEQSDSTDVPTTATTLAVATTVTTEVTDTTVADTEPTEPTTSLGAGPPPKPEGLIGFETMKGPTPPAPTYEDFDARLAATSFGSSIENTGFSAETYDALVVLALAATAAGTDGLVLADEIVHVVQDGTACTTYAECSALLAEDTDIDYDGISGLLPMNGKGDLLVSTFSVVEFGADQRLDPNRTSSGVGVDLPRASDIETIFASGDRPGDGTFKVGALVPETGYMSVYGPPINAALELALGDINAGGGVLGSPMELVSRDSGDGTDDVGVNAANELVAEGVDAVVGPVNSDLAYEVIDIFTGAGIAIVSQGAGWDALSNYPDQGLFFRLAPADSMQASVIGDLLSQDLNRSYVIVARDDEYGEAIAAALRAYVEAFAITLLDDVRYTAGTDMAGFLDQAQSLADLAPDAVVFVGFYEDGGVLQALVDRGLSPTVQNFYVNDAVLFDDFGLDWGLIGGE